MKDLKTCKGNASRSSDRFTSSRDALSGGAATFKSTSLKNQIVKSGGGGGGV